VDELAAWIGAAAQAVVGFAALGSLAAAAALALRLLRLRRQRPADAGWAREVAARLTALDGPFEVDGEGHVRGLLGGRASVFARTAQGVGVAVVRLQVPTPDPEPGADGRAGLRLPPTPTGERVAARWVQVWQAGLRPEQAPALAARALSLARAADAQATAPWELYADQHGLNFRPSDARRPCTIRGEVGGVPVHVELTRTREPQVQTVIVAGLPRRGLGPALVDVGGLLQRYQDAELVDDTVRIRIPGLVTDGLAERVADAVALARAFAGGARG